MFASVPDLLRLLSLPVLAWAAYRDVRTRRVSKRVWPPLFGLAVALLLWEGWRALSAGGGGFAWTAFAVGTGISLLLVVPAAYLFWRLGAFGGADAKALMVLAALFPTFPAYHVGSLVLPLRATPTGAFGLTLLSNTVLVGALYPLALAARNALAGRVTPAMVVGRSIGWDEAERTHGRLLETTEGFTRSGLDLDALRMYLRWRGATLAELRSDPARYRDPGSLPDEPLPAGDGAIADGGRPDRWGAEAFLADVGSAYGTTPEGLPLTPEDLETVTITTATRNDPHAPLRRYATRVADLRARTFQGIAPVVSPVFNRAHGEVLSETVDAELIVDEDTLSASRSAYPEALDGALEADSLGLYVHPGSLSFGLSLFEDHAFAGIYDESGQFVACFDGGAESFRERVGAVYERHREAARSVEAAELK